MSENTLEAIYMFKEVSGANFANNSMRSLLLATLENRIAGGPTRLNLANIFDCPYCFALHLQSEQECFARLEPRLSRRKQSFLMYCRKHTSQHRI